MERNIAATAHNFNRTVADYRNEAALLICSTLFAARNYEPLDFLVLTGTTGRLRTRNIGLPPLTVGPETPVGALNSVRNYSFGPYTASASQSSDFTATNRECYLLRRTANCA
jgi:hypothetical protein